MSTTIKLKNSVTTTAAPSSLVQGEVATNVTDKKLWVGNAASSPVQLLGAGATVSGTNVDYTGTLTGGTGVVNLGSGQFYKDASGNVGFSIAAPAAPVDAYREVRVSYLSGNQYRMRLTDTDGNGKILVDGDASQLIFGTAPAGTNATAVERMRIDSSGNVGIGTSSPTSKLDVVGVAKGSTLQASGTAAGGFSANSWFVQNEGSSINRVYSCGANSSTYGVLEEYSALSNGTPSRTRYANNDTHIFFTNASERMRIDSSGNLLVGTSAKIGADTVTIQGTDTAGTPYCLFAQASTASGLAYALRTYSTTTSTVAGSISFNGTTTAFNTSSDYRLKQDVIPMTGALAKVSALKPVTYKWKADGSDGEGFIAHELAEICPQAVVGKKDGTRIEAYEISPAIPAEIDEDGKIIKEAVEAVMGEREVPDYQGIDTSFLVATLTAAIKEQQVMINELKAKVAALEAA